MPLVSLPHRYARPGDTARCTAGIHSYWSGLHPEGGEAATLAAPRWLADSFGLLFAATVTPGYDDHAVRAHGHAAPRSASSTAAPLSRRGARTSPARLSLAPPPGRGRAEGPVLNTTALCPDSARAARQGRAAREARRAPRRRAAARELQRCDRGAPGLAARRLVQRVAPCDRLCSWLARFLCQFRQMVPQTGLLSSLWNHLTADRSHARLQCGTNYRNLQKTRLHPSVVHPSAMPFCPPGT